MLLQQIDPRRHRLYRADQALRTAVGVGLLLGSLWGGLCAGDVGDGGAQVKPDQAAVHILVQSSPLAGFQYYAGESHWAQMHEGDALILIREPDNSHDTQAVRVEWRGLKLGYLPRRENRLVAQAMDRGERMGARIARLQQHANPWHRVLIDVFVRL
jgi:hypothetical protein